MEAVSQRTQTPSGGRLLALVTVTVIIGCFLAALARTPFSLPSDSVNLNAVDSERLALALEVDLTITDRIIRERERLHGFRSVTEAISTPILAPGRQRERARAALRALDVNRADSAAYADALEIPMALANRIVEARSARGGRFERAEDVLDVRALPDHTIALWRDRLIVRGPVAALGQVALWAACFAVLVGFTAFWRVRRCPHSDPTVLPLMWFLVGVPLCVWAGLVDPLRDNIRLGTHVLSVAVGVVAMVVAFELLGGRPRGANDRGPTGAIAWGVGFILWVAVSAWSHGGRAFGVPGLPWLGPTVTLLALIELMRWRNDRDGFLWTVGEGRAGAASSAGLPVLCTVLLYVGSRNLGITVVGGTAVLLLLAATLRRRVWLMPGALGVVAVVLAAPRLFGGSQQTFREWLRPTVRTEHASTQLVEQLWALSSGGFWGSGLGLGSPGALPVPEAASYAAVGEELGSMGALAMLVVVSLLVWRTCRAAGFARDARGRLGAVAMGSLLATQAFWSAAGSTGLMPSFLVPFPLVVCGHVQTVLWFAWTGWLLAVSHHASRMLPSANRQEFRRALFGLVATVTVLLVGAVGVRTFYVQAIAADRMASLSLRIGEGQRLRVSSNPRLESIARTIPRGSIYDASGRVVATSRLREISDALADNAALARRYYHAGRFYPYGAATVAAVGLWSRFTGATCGVERELDAHLRGYKDTRELLAVYRGKDLPAWLRRRPPMGGDVVLSIDAEQCRRALTVLNRYCRTDGSAGEGHIVVLHALEGHPIVAVSTPSTDPNRAVLQAVATAGDLGQTGVTPEALLPAPKGPVKIAYALSMPPELADFEVVCRHSLDRVTWSDHGMNREVKGIADHPDDPPHGRIRAGRAIKVSCEVFFAEMASRLGPDRLYNRLHDLVGLPIIGSRAEFGAALVNLVAGRDAVPLSPMQVACLMVAATSGSRVGQPHYWYELRHADGGESDFVPPAVEAHTPGAGHERMAEIVRTALVEAAVEGPLDEVFHELPFRVAGRTATVKPSPAATTEDAWFYGYAPTRNPAFAIVVVIRSGGSGYRTAAKAARDVLGELTRQ